MVAILSPEHLRKEIWHWAYTQKVAELVRAIASTPEEAYRYTAKGNLVAVITDLNTTAD